MLDRMEGAVLLLHSFFQVTQFNKLGVKLLVLRALKRERDTYQPIRSLEGLNGPMRALKREGGSEAFVAVREGAAQNTL